MIQFQKPQTALEVFWAIDRGENKFWNADQKQYAISLLDKAVLILTDLICDYENVSEKAPNGILKELIRVQTYKRMLIDGDNSNSIILANGDRLKLNEGQITQLRAAQAMLPMIPRDNGFRNAIREMESLMKKELQEMEDEIEHEINAPQPRPIDEIRKEPLDSTIKEFFETGGFWVVGFWALVGVIVYLTW